jgi:alkylated DNA repair protein alkB family protein 7
MHPESDLAHETPLHTPPHLLSHLLHLSSTGYILPHVDNVQASAGTILGLCLGSERDLVLTSTKAGHEGDQIRVRLPPGCAYVQRWACIRLSVVDIAINASSPCRSCRGQIRYTWKHEIPAADPRNSAQSGQRLSVMIRVRDLPLCMKLRLIIIIVSDMC